MRGRRESEGRARKARSRGGQLGGSRDGAGEEKRGVRDLLVADQAGLPHARGARETKGVSTEGLFSRKRRTRAVAGGRVGGRGAGGRRDSRSLVDEALRHLYVRARGGSRGERGSRRARRGVEGSDRGGTKGGWAACVSWCGWVCVCVPCTHGWAGGQGTRRRGARGEREPRTRQLCPLARFKRSLSWHSRGKCRVAVSSSRADDACRATAARAKRRTRFPALLSLSLGTVSLHTPVAASSRQAKLQQRPPFERERASTTNGQREG